MKALHIITGLGVGGAEQQLRLLLRHLPVDCDVVTLTNPGTVADGLTADGVRVVPPRHDGNRDLAALPRLVQFDPRRAVTTWCTPTSTAPASTAGSPPAWPGSAPWSPPSTPRRLPDGGPPADRRRPRALSGERAARPGHRRRLPDGRRPPRALGCAPARVSRSCPTASTWPASASTRRCATTPADGSACRRTRTSSAGVGRLVRRQALRRPHPGPGPTAGRLLAVCSSADGPRRAAAPYGSRRTGRRRPCPVRRRAPLTSPSARRRPDLPALPERDGPARLPVRRRGVRAGRRGGAGAGLPVLYVSCPAVEDLPPPWSPRPCPRSAATRRRSPVQALRIVRGPARGRARPRTPPTTTASARSAARLMDVYGTALAGSSDPSVQGVSSS